MTLFIGIITLTVTVAILFIMMYVVWKDTMNDVKKDGKFKNTVYATQLAERKFEEMVRNTEYRIVRNPVRIINESDINWGKEKEVLL